MSTNGLIHQLAWAPAALSEEALSFQKVAFLVGNEEHNEILSAYQKQLTDAGYVIAVVNDATELGHLLAPDTIIVHIPYTASAKSDIYEAATKSCTSLIAAAQLLYQNSQSGQNKTSKLFSLISLNGGIGDLGYTPLSGLARAMKMEIPEIFGGLFEEDKGSFPLSAIKYARGFDVVRVSKGVAQRALLQPFPDESNDKKQLQFKSEGSSYLITGGTRGMGLEIATWMGRRGARSIVLVSRRGLSPSLDSNTKNAGNEKLISRIKELEALGTTVHVLAIDISKPGADSTLKKAIDNLHIPPIKGVVHAAGIAGYNTIERCTPSDVAEILAPKVIGSLNLDALFPPGTLDFFISTSSVGQLVGFSGQLAYAPANAFLDGLAAQRRSLGDNSMSILWTCWRGVGLMAESKSATRMITKGMQARGIGEISKDEAFEAWDRFATLGSDHVAVVRVLELDADEPLRHPVLKNITPRVQRKQTRYSNYPKHAVAVVGMACRTAAGDTPDDLWQVIQTGKSMVREIDVKRFPDAAKKGKMWGNFLSDAESFDHQFFKKSKREAAALDPHQRVLLETTYHALESAGWLGDGQQQEAETNDKPKTIDTTGCFIGMNAPDYPLNLASHPTSPYTGFGMLRSFAAGRLSHHFGWTGPSQTIDTACSSAMVAIHQACRAIQVGECTQAVAGGVNLITNTALFDALRTGGFLSETGPCKTFDALADGYCRGESVGVLILKPLERALKDGNNIQGVLLSTGNNQNINTTSITNPVLESQAALYRDVLARAGVNPKDVSYVEVHGTGTRAGDPTEVAGIRQVFGGKDRSTTLHIGAVKPNIGHSEGSSGVISLIKVLLMMKHGKITPQAQFKSLNPNIPALEPDQMAISTSLKEWRDDLRFAVVNSYGASGNNAAAVVAPPPARSSSLPTVMESVVPTPPISTWPIFIAAASSVSLLAYCNKLKDQIEKTSSAPELAHLAFALATKQNRQLQHVFATTTTSLDDLQGQLADPEKHITASTKPKPIVLLFSGQNGNTVQSASPLYNSSRLFRTHLHQCDEVMQSLGLPSLFPAVLQGLQDDADLVLRHAAMFAIQYSCGMSWIDSGVKPQAVSGHSFGEWAALTLSGALTLESGIRLVTGYTFFLLNCRASIIQKLWGDDTGSMVAIEADLTGTDTTPEENLEPFRKKHPETKLDIACYNGPNNYVVAGSTKDIEVLESYLNDRKSSGEKLRFKVLKGMHAYHSVMADSIVDASNELSASIPFKDPTFPFESCHKDPWTGPGVNVIARNTRGAVYFGQAISRIVNRLGPCTFLEAGFGGPIIAMARNALPQAQAQAQHTFVAISGKDSARSLADATVTLWRSGQPNGQFWPFHRSQRENYVSVTLPQYQFENHRHWLEYIPRSNDGSKKTDEQVQALSGRCPHCLKDVCDYPYIEQDKSQNQGAGKFVFKVDPRSRRFQELVKGHAVVGSPISPASMYLELPSHAIALLHNAQVMSTATELAAEALEIKAPLGLDSQRSIKVILTKKTEDTWGFELSSTKNNHRPTSHATGIISLRSRHINNQQDDKDKWARTSSLLENDTDVEALRGTMVYKVFEKMAKYSPPYRGLRYLVGKGTESAGEITMPDNLDVMARTPNANIADPLVIDNFFQVPGAFVHSLRGDNEEEENGGMSYICTGMGAVGPLNGLQNSGKYRAYTQIVRESNKEAVLDVFALDQQSKKVIWSAKGLKFSRVPRNSLVKVLAEVNPGLVLKEHSTGPSKSTVDSPTPKSTYQATRAAPPKKSTRDDSNAVNVLSGVQEVLSRSLDIPIEEVTKQATLEDLGTDSLVSAEILANISDKFKINISTDIFAALTDVASLCSLISTKVGGDVSETSENNGEEEQAPDAFSDTVEEGSSEWQKTVVEILSKSLDVPVEEIQMDSNLEDLGADSLVAAEIISNLNDAFNVNISSTDFASIVDVISLCNHIAGTAGFDSVQTPLSSLSDASFTQSTSKAESPLILDTGATTPKKASQDWMHTAFQGIRRNFDVHAKETQHTGYWKEVYPPQLITVTAFITEAFEKLGCPIKNFKQGDKLPALQETLPKYHREVPRLWEILEEAGVAEKKGDDYVRGPTPLNGDLSGKSAQQLSSDLISDFPQFASTHGLPDLLGPHLAECLTGKSDPVSLLFGSEKGRSLLEHFYANGPDLLATTKVLCDFLSAAIHAQASDGEPFRILEIGAGTGGTTKHLVPLLQATGLPFIYTFTELSVSLLARAKKTIFNGIVGMEFRKLNIEEEPPAELLGRYHMVVSSNCIHATRDLRCCLGNIRKMVRSDGCVALVELTQKLAWYDLVWGLLDGWWLFDDGRKYALQSPWAWERVMRDSGFAHVDWSESSSRESRGIRVICGMAAELDRTCPTKVTSMLLHRATSGSSGRNLFLCPDGFGSGAVFGSLVPLLDRINDVSVYALNSPFLKNKPDLEDPPTIEEFAAIYVAEIKRRQPKGPYLLGGYSIGGVIAYEAARQLLEDGNEVERLFLIDAACPTFVTSLPSSLADFLDLINQTSVVKEDRIQEKTKGQSIKNDHFTLARHQLLRYQVSPLPGRKIPQATLFSAREGVDKQDQVPRPKALPEEEKIAGWFLDDRTDDGSLGWNELLSSVSVVRADGNHFSMMTPPMIASWGSELAKLLSA
ncbi:hypothetical protein EAF04_009090 [Stromatinia cepivora]|nr:hypothetical protein EAF04_009090 [Stromatinia cepivora]